MYRIQCTLYTLHPKNRNTAFWIKVAITTSILCYPNPTSLKLSDLSKIYLNKCYFRLLILLSKVSKRLQQEQQEIQQEQQQGESCHQGQEQQSQAPTGACAAAVTRAGVCRAGEVFTTVRKGGLSPSPSVCLFLFSTYLEHQGIEVQQSAVKVSVEVYHG